MESEVNALLKDFTGRDWLVAEVVDTLEVGSVALVGSPAVGKTTLAAKLVEQNICTASHFVRAGSLSSTDPNRFCRDISWQLAHRLPGFSDLVAEQTTTHIQGSVRANDVQGTAYGVYIENLALYTSSPLESFVRIIRNPLETWLKNNTRTQPIVLLVDGVDESLGFHRGLTILDIIRTSLDLPDPVRWLLTTRPIVQIEDLEVRTISLDYHTPNHQNDLRLFANRTLTGLSGRQIDDVVRRSDGSFLYLRLVADEVLRDSTRDVLAGLPTGIEGYYRRFLQRLLDRHGEDAWRETHRPVLGVACAAAEPMEFQLFAELCAQPAELVNDAWNDLKEFFRETTSLKGVSQFGIFHSSFADFLTTRDTSGRFWIDVTSYHMAIGTHFLGAYSSDWTHCPDYGINNLYYHLDAGAKTEELNTLALDFRWYRERVGRNSVNELISDLRYFGDSASDVICQALQLSSHVLEQQPNQLVGQLFARLLGENLPAVTTLLESIAKVPEMVFLRPRRASMRPPGGPEVRRLLGHSGEVTNLAFFDTSRLMASASLDGSVVVWDLQSGSQRIRFNCDVSATAVAVTPDGEYVFGGYSNGLVRRWSTQSGYGRDVFQFENESAVCNLGFCDKGRTLVSASIAGHVWCLNCASGEVTKLAQVAPIHALASNVDSDRFVTVGCDNRLVVWSSAVGERINEIDESGDGLWNNAVAIGDQGRRALTTSHDRIRLWDLESGRLLGEQYVGHHWIHDFAFSEDGKRFLCAGNSLELFDTDELRPELSLPGHAGGVRCAAFARIEGRAASGDVEGTIIVWDVNAEQAKVNIEETDQKIGRFFGLSSGTSMGGGRSRRLTALAIADSPKFAVTTYTSNVLLGWNLETGDPTLMASVDREDLYMADSVATCVAVDAKGQTIVAGGWNGTLSVIDVPRALSDEKYAKAALWRGALLGVGQVLCVDLSPDAAKVAAGTSSGLAIFDTREVIDEIETAFYRSGKAEDPDEYEDEYSEEDDDEGNESNKRIARIAFSVSGDTIFCVFDGARNKPPELACTDLNANVLWKVSLSSEVTAFCRTNESIVIGTSEGALEIYEGSSGSLGWRTQMTSGSVQCVTADEPFKTLAVGTSDGEVLVFDVVSHECLGSTKAHLGQIHCVAVHSDLIASGGEDKEVQVRSIDELELVASFLGDSAITHCGWNPSTNAVIAGEQNGPLHILALEGASAAV